MKQTELGEVIGTHCQHTIKKGGKWGPAYFTHENRLRAPLCGHSEYCKCVEQLFVGVRLVHVVYFDWQASTHL